MPTGTIAPVIKHQFFTDAGLIAAGYKLFSYEAGTSTKLATYSDVDLTVPNTNPLVLDAAGRATIFLSANSYKFVLAPDDDTDPPTSPVWTVDNVTAISALAVNSDVVGTAGEAISAGQSVYVSDGSGGKTAGRWYKADASNTYSSSAAFAVGIAPSAITSAEEGIIRILGKVTGLSSLTAGSIYYIDSTAGGITVTAPSNPRIIGFADSSTSLIVSPGPTVSSSGGASVGGGVNLAADAQFLIWAAGDAAAPTHYTTGGVTPSVARAGTGLGDTNQKFGPYCAKVQGAAGGAGTLVQSLLPAASFDSYWQSQPFSLGAFVKCSTGSSARLLIYDGAGTSFSGYHTGAGAWEWLTVSRTLDGSASEFTVGLETAANIVSYVSGVTVVTGSTVPTAPIPSQPIYGTIVMKVGGTLAAAASSPVDRFFPARPLLIRDVMLYAATAPVGADLEVGIWHWDGSAIQATFSTLPTIVDGALSGQAQPDGTYRYRCFGAGHAADYTDGLVAMSVEQVGSTTEGADLTVFIRCLQFARPLEDWLGYNE